MDKGYTPGVNMCIHCAEIENLIFIPSLAPHIFGPGDYYCMKHYGDVVAWIDRLLGGCCDDS